jgi:hypothetical protein
VSDYGQTKGELKSWYMKVIYEYDVQQRPKDVYALNTSWTSQAG